MLYRPLMSKRLRKEEKIGLLEKLPLFESCTDRELGDIASIMVEAERPAGTVLTREGRDGGLMFIIVEGTAEVVASDGTEASKVVNRLKAGDVVGELALIDGRARSATVRATSTIRVLDRVRRFQRLGAKIAEVRPQPPSGPVAAGPRRREPDELDGAANAGPEARPTTPQLSLRPVVPPRRLRRGPRRPSRPYRSVRCCYRPGTASPTPGH